MLGKHFFARVTAVDLPSEAGDKDLECVDDMPYLNQLDLSGTAITKVGLNRVWKHSQLTALSLRSTCISDSEAPNLESLQQLTFLGLGHTAITDKSVEVLIRLRHLEYVSLEGTHVTHAPPGLPDGNPQWYGEEMTWAAAPSEEQRRIAAALERRGARVDARRKFDGGQTKYSVLWFARPVDDHLLGLLEDLAALRALILGQTSVTDEQWSRIAGNAVSIANDTQAAKRDASGVNGLTRLTTLVIRDVPVRDGNMRHIARLVNLEVLALRNAQITDADLASLASLQNLKQLFLEGPFLTDAGLAHLKRLPHLEELDLDGAQFTDAALAHVGTLANLERLWLFDAPVTDAGLAHLTGLTNLRDLVVHSPNITDAAIRHLAQLLSRLEYCSVNGRQVVPDPNETESERPAWRLAGAPPLPPRSFPPGIEPLKIEVHSARGRSLGARNRSRLSSNRSSHSRWKIGLRSALRIARSALAQRATRATSSGRDCGPQTGSQSPR